MRIAGSYKELSFLIRLADQMKGEYLYFGPEGDFWMVYDNGRVAYVRTQLEISHHLVLGKRSFGTLLNAFHRIHKNEDMQAAIKDDVDKDYVAVGEEFIQVGKHTNERMMIYTRMERIGMFSPLVKKLESMKQISEPDGTPYIKLEYPLLKQYSFDVRDYFRQFKKNWKLQDNPFKAQDNEFLNIMSVDENGDLLIHRGAPKGIDAPLAKFTYPTGWFVPEKYYDYSFYMSDTDLRLMLMSGRREHIFEYRILLFKDHYIIDSHEADLRFKMWLNRSKNALSR